MFEPLFAKLPRDIVIEIVIFEGRVMDAYLQEYVSQVYSGVYKKYFGYRHTLAYVTRNKCSLPFYAAWSALVRAKYPNIVKKRTPRGFMRLYTGIVPVPRLEQERKRMARKIDSFFNRKTGPTLTTSEQSF